jgi:hypothetical protein
MFANPVRPAVCCTLLACPLADFLDFWKKQDLTSDDCRDLAQGYAVEGKTITEYI